MALMMAETKRLRNIF